MKNVQKKIRFGLLIAITTMITQCHIQSINDLSGEEIVQAAITLHQKATALPLHTIILDQNLSTDEKIQEMKDLLMNENKAIDINAQDAGGKTTLNLAAFYNADPAIIQFLINNKAKVNEPDRFNETPLHNAIAKEAIETAKILLAAGASPDLKNDKLETPIDLARSPNTKALFGLEA